MIIKHKNFATGEATAHYMTHPLAAKRAYEVVPNAKIIVMLRNPVDRAYSHYQMEKANKKEELTFEEAIEKVKNNTCDLVITDLRMGEQSGFDVLKTAKTQSYKPEVIVITAYGTIESAVNAIKLDAFDYLT